MCEPLAYCIYENTLYAGATTKLKFDVCCDFPHYHTTFSENVNFFKERQFVTDSLFPTSRYKYIYYYENVRGNSVNNNALSKIEW